MSRKVSKRSGYVYIDGQREHRMVWRAAYGKIPYGWVVHHINCVKDDNRLENLVALPAWYHDKIHALMRQGVVYTQDDLLKEYVVLKAEHEQYTQELKDALKAVKSARERLNCIGVPNVAIDKYITKLASQKDPKRKKKITTKQFVDMRKPKRERVRQSTKEERDAFKEKQNYPVADMRAILRSGGL